jgi:hypothetical protein
VGQHIYGGDTGDAVWGSPTPNAAKQYATVCKALEAEQLRMTAASIALDLLPEVLYRQRMFQVFKDASFMVEILNETKRKMEDAR